MRNSVFEEKNLEKMSNIYLNIIHRLDMQEIKMKQEFECQNLKFKIQILELQKELEDSKLRNRMHQDQQPIQAGTRIPSAPYGQHVPQQYGVPYTTTEAFLPPAYQTPYELYKSTMQYGSANNQVPPMTLVPPTIQNACVMPPSPYVTTRPLAHYVPQTHLGPVITGTTAQLGSHFQGTHTPMMRATNPPWMPRGIHNIPHRPHIVQGPYTLTTSFFPPGHYVNPVQTQTQTSQSSQLNRNMHTASCNQTVGTVNNHNPATNQPNHVIVVNEKTIQHTPDYTNLSPDVMDRNDEVASPHEVASHTYQQPSMDDPSIIEITPTPREDYILRTQQNQSVNNLGDQESNLNNQDAIFSFLERGRASTRMERTQH
ncbi:hypothetical protein DPMN_100161 [Dreissena polymorpha]|uniref:Uncharacterized protein n=1 Tax=Dreissena polymorpha TaxID=45954 RepID=A0A9D4R745_DREPO|nr:hypothetical protein DPMN_100161 [Dreissena polymorpha]